MKKAVSIVCCICLILSSVMLVFPALAAENTSIEEFAESISNLYTKKVTLENFELDNYLAEISLDYGDPSYVTLMNSFFEVLPASMFMVEAGKKTFEPALEAWYTTKIVANPGNALNNLNYKQQYQAIIYAILFDALCDSKMNSFSYENAITKVSGFTKKVVNSWNDAEIIDKTDLTATEKESLKEVALTFIDNGESNLSAFGDYVELVNKISKTIDKFLKTTTDVMTYIEKISMMSQLIDTGNAGINYLYLLKSNTNDTYLKDAIQSVIDSLSNDWVGMIEEVLIDATYTFSKNSINKLIKRVWNKVCAINPFLAGMSIGDVAGTFACNVLFGTEDMIEKYSSMKKYVEIHKAALAAFSDTESICGQNRTNDNVGLWLFAINFLQSEITSNYQVSLEFAKATTLNGAVNKFTSLFSDEKKQTYDEFKEEVDWFLDFHKRAYYQFYQSRNYRLQDDYPELYQKIYGYISVPQPISEIKFTDKQSTNFIKGSIINLNFDIYPSEYIGEIAVICNSNIVSVENNLKCWAQDIGEAEITVYSVDNPEICDTVKINIINNAISFEQTILKYSVNNDNKTCTITGILTGFSPTFLDIPESISGYTVTEIGKGAFYDYRNLANVTIPDSITSIGEKAFDNTAYYNNSSNWKNNVLYIGKHLIQAKTSISGSYAIKEGTLMIADKAFDGCKNLTSITIPDSVTSIGHYAFDRCTSLTSTTIGNGVTSIGKLAFYACTSLTGITIPDNVTSIGRNAFGYCNSLTSVTIPDSITSIDGEMFYGCTSLTSATIGNSVTSIGYEAFYGCTNLTGITIPDSVTSIGRDAFRNCSSLTSITIPASTKYESSFYGCTKIEKIIITSGAGETPNYIFSNGISSPWNVSETNSLEIIIQDGINKIDSSTFRECHNLTKISLGKDVTSIGDYAFLDCNSLTSITIPDSVTNIGKASFADCKSLTYIIIPDSITSIGERAFENTAYYNNSSNWENDVLYIGKHLIKAKTSISGSYAIKEGTLTIADKTFDGCYSLQSITIPGSIKSMCKGTFSGCKYLKTVTILNGVTSINDSAFSGCEYLKTISIPDSLTSIGDYAFTSCESLTNITIPDNVIHIGKSAFTFCDSLKHIAVGKNNENYSSDEYGVLFNKNQTKLICYPAGNIRTNYEIPETVISIDYDAFCGCDSLINITIPNNVTSIEERAFYACYNLTSIIIPDSIKTIGYQTFGNCFNLAYITLPDSVTSIGNVAFDNCNNITDIYYSGTKEQWKTIEIGNYNDQLLNATIHYNCNGDDEPVIPEKPKTDPTTVPAVETTTQIVETMTQPVETTELSTTKPVKVPSTTKPAGSTTTTSVTPTTKPTESITKPSTEPITKPTETATVPVDNEVMKTPSQKTITYGDSIILHADVDKVPEGATIEWTADNANFTYTVSEDGTTCTITPAASGDTVFTVTVVDKNGDVISSDTQAMTAKAGLWQKIVAFFKKLFGMTKVYSEIFERR